MTSTVPKRNTRDDARVAELEAALERERRSVRDQSALYQIAALANAADDMRSFYEGVHDVLRGLLYVENLYVALYDEERQLINFPYYVDVGRHGDSRPATMEPSRHRFRFRHDRIHPAEGSAPSRRRVSV